MMTDILNRHKVKKLCQRVLDRMHEVNSFVELLSFSEIIYFIKHVSSLEVEHVCLVEILDVIINLTIYFCLI